MKTILTLFLAAFMIASCSTQTDYDIEAKLKCIKEYIRTDIIEDKDPEEWVIVVDDEICFSDGSCRNLNEDMTFRGGFNVGDVWITENTTLSIQVREAVVFIWGTDLVTPDRGLVHIYYEIQ